MLRSKYWYQIGLKKSCIIVSLIKRNIFHFISLSLFFSMFCSVSHSLSSPSSLKQKTSVVFACLQKLWRIRSKMFQLLHSSGMSLFFHTFPCWQSLSTVDDKCRIPHLCTYYSNQRKDNTMQCFRWDEKRNVCLQVQIMSQNETVPVY